uniref:GIY-YIG domain-containing protein n=1 Tax=viral metagenome TaxID=1070528 RepID=A0A6C0HV29_9ZZZZ
MSHEDDNICDTVPGFDAMSERRDINSCNFIQETYEGTGLRSKSSKVSSLQKGGFTGLVSPTAKLDVGSNKWYCYILRNKQSRYAHLTYNGSTNHPIRRLRQHNEEISGGARYTHGRGGGWEIYALLSGFPDHKNALSCEWRMKHTNGKPGKRPPEHCGMKGRIVALNDILQLEKWTQQCTHSNYDQQFTLYLADDVVSLVNVSALPPNITLSRDMI